MAEDVKIVIGADTSQLSAEMIAAENQLRKLQASLKKLSDVKDIEKTQQSIRYLKETITGLNAEAATAGKQLGGALKQGAGQATTAMTNLSRVVQDAPFGFMGVANNINPLLESFQRLKSETGSTGGALKALASSFMGGAGLGLAVSVATSLLVVFGDKLFATSKSATDFSEANKKLAEGLQSAKESATATGFALQSYVDIARNGNLPLEQRNVALKEANKILGEHGEKLTLTNIATERATQLVNLYTQALIAQGVAAKYNDRVAELIIKKQDTLNALNEQAIKIDQLKGQQLANANKLIQLRGRNDEVAAYQAVSAADDVARAIDKQIEIQKELAIIEAEITKQTKNATQATLDMTSAFGLMGYKAKETHGHIKKVKEELDKLTYKKGKLPLMDLLPKLNIPDKLEPLKLEIVIPPISRRLIDLEDDFYGFFEQMAEGAASIFAETLAQGMTIGSFFDGIFKMLGQGMVQLGKTFVALAISVNRIKESLLAKPIIALAAGITLIAIGSAIQNAYKKQAFAVGTTFAPGGMALVGERGPELVNIPRGGQVIPAGRTSQLMGGIESMQVYGVLRGQDIYFSNKKYGQTYGRAT